MTTPSPTTGNLDSRLEQAQVELVNLWQKIEQQGFENELKVAWLSHVQSIADLTNCPELMHAHPSVCQLLEASQSLKTKTDWENASKAIKALLDLIQHAYKLHQSEDKHPHYPILLGTTNQNLINEISSHFQIFGYKVISFTCFAEARRYLEVYPFSAVLVDADLREQIDKPPFEDYDTPVIFISSHDDLDTRLFCVQAGGQAYFTTPLEYSALIEKIDDLVSNVDQESPYRILIIEDSKTQAIYIKQCLKDPFVETEILLEPMQLLDVMNDFRPDLVLMDLHMPKCSGADIAKVLRQNEAYVSIPIIFLSSEQDARLKLSMISQGGDDFLSKPIDSLQLNTIVKARVKRSRRLRSEMIQDSLTGLLNHTRILEQLQLEIEHAKRHKSKLAFAMLDLDHFKEVNDTYGHMVGDRVIRSIARFLKKHLRKSDSIGRYGGEEFAIILPDTDSHLILQHLNAIRESFAKVLHKGGSKKDFHCSFSAGISEFCEKTNSVDAICEMADLALYEAKNQGRNQIISADDINPENSRNQKST